MWKCDNCQEEIEDKYKHCWSCGSPKPAGEEPAIRYKRIEEEPKIKVESIPIVKVEPIVESKVATPKVEPEPEIPLAPAPVEQDDFLSSTYQGKISENPPSIIWTIIPVLLWLAITGATAYFAYISNQKTTNFNNQIVADGQSFNSQKSNVTFPQTDFSDRRNKIKIEGNIKGKVLPLNKVNNEVAELFYTLPDDLRPTNLDEAKTVFWLDCKPEEIGRSKNGVVRSQEKCNTFLVDRETNRFIGIQEFLGVPPALTNDRENVGAVGKVLPDKYLSYLREKQSENERGTSNSASESPNHHFFNQSEFYLAIGLLCFLGAIGLGWVLFRIKSAFN
jgi:hypothetical protein